MWQIQKNQLLELSHSSTSYRSTQEKNVDAGSLTFIFSMFFRLKAKTDGGPLWMYPVII